MPDSDCSVSSKIVSLSWRAIAFVLCIAGLAGCSEEPQISRMKVPKPPKVEAADRMLAAIVPAKGRGWFFKLSGARKEVDGQVEKFLALLKSITVNEDKVDWKTPAGWSSKGASEMRVATLAVDGTKLECAVSFLPADDATTSSYLLANLNRWRGQIGLGNMSEAELPKEPTDSGETRQLKLADGTPIVWVDLIGTLSSGGSMPFAGGAPFANRGDMSGPPRRAPERDEQGPVGPSKAAPRTPSSSTQAPANDEFTYTQPKHWKTGRTGEFRKAAFEVKDGKDSIEITVSSLAVEGSALLPNINRWRGQISLPPFDDAQLKKAAEAVEIDGKPGQVFDLIGEKETILGAVVIVESQGWFFKLKGSKTLAAKEKAAFVEFVKSVKFK